jgi:hypothetical protein
VKVTIYVKRNYLPTVLTDMADRIAHPRPWLAEVGLGIMDAVHEHFRNQEGPFGPWPDLAPAYAAFKERYVQQPILTFWGYLKESIGFEVGDREVAAFPGAAPPGFGSPLSGGGAADPAVYGPAHDLGIGQKERRFMWLSDADWDSLEESLYDWVLNGDPSWRRARS